MARHTGSLFYGDLVSSTVKLLSEIGSFAFIIPFSEEEKFISLTKSYKLFPNRITRVKGENNTDVKRSLLQFSFIQSSIEVIIFNLLNTL